ncbi:MAG: hypothetical protein JBO36_19485, partial [Candidatus Thiodiazotropha taylori]|nr:hypothetical protein [Candidatus Thiodiazotropha taylori]
MQQSAKIERQPGFLPRADFQRLLDGVVKSGYQLLGPVVKDGAIQLMEISDATQLVKGLTNEQQPGRYRLQQTA